MCLGEFMLKNNKGFTLLEVLVVVLIIGILAGIGIPQYRTSVRKARVSVNMPLLRALQDDVVNYYNLNNERPTTLWQLSLDRREFEQISNKKGRHLATNCTIELQDHVQIIDIVEECGQGWSIMYRIGKSSLGYVPGPKLFMTGGIDTNASIAKSFGWSLDSTNIYRIK